MATFFFNRRTLTYQHSKASRRASTTLAMPGCLPRSLPGPPGFSSFQELSDPGSSLKFGYKLTYHPQGPFKVLLGKWFFNLNQQMPVMPWLHQGWFSQQPYEGCGAGIWPILWIKAPYWRVKWLVHSHRGADLRPHLSLIRSGLQPAEQSLGGGAPQRRAVSPVGWHDRLHTGKASAWASGRPALDQSFSNAYPQKNPWELVKGTESKAPHLLTEFQEVIMPD